MLKSESVLNGRKIHYKLSGFEIGTGITGHECVNEIIVDRLLSILGVEHLHYSLIHAVIELEGREFTTFLCASEDFKNCLKGESHYDFCVRMGWQDYIETMIAMDYLIQNRDRHGANIEVLRNARQRTIRIAPLFDHGRSLLFSCRTPQDIRKFDIMADRQCQNFIGSSSCEENLNLIRDRKKVFAGSLKESDRSVIPEGLEGILQDDHLEHDIRKVQAL